MCLRKHALNEEQKKKITGEKSSKAFCAMQPNPKRNAFDKYKTVWHLCVQCALALAQEYVFNIEMIDRLDVAGVPI